MSYEGYVEQLCETGHLSSFDAYDYDSGEGVCTQCKKPFVFVHHVDETNGIEYDEHNTPNPYTVGYPFEEVGFEDKWHVDHHGNKYATKIPFYKIPNNG